MQEVSKAANLSQTLPLTESFVRPCAGVQSFQEASRTRSLKTATMMATFSPKTLYSLQVRGLFIEIMQNTKLPKSSFQNGGLEIGTGLKDPKKRTIRIRSRTKSVSRPDDGGEFNSEPPQEEFTPYTSSLKKC